MRSVVLALAAFLLVAGLVLGTRATAGETGPGWDDSHMASRHRAAAPGETRPKVVLGKDRLARAANDPAPTPSQQTPERLDSHTQRSWAVRGTQSISFGSQPARSGSSDRSLSGPSRGSQLRSAVRGSGGGRSSR